jgi:hypothetical protein
MAAATEPDNAGNKLFIVYQTMSHSDELVEAAIFRFCKHFGTSVGALKALKQKPHISTHAYCQCCTIFPTQSLTRNNAKHCYHIRSGAAEQWSSHLSEEQKV